MRIFELIVSIGSFLFEKIKILIFFVIQFIVFLFMKIFDKFREVDFPEKIIFINTIAAAFAVVMPVARFELPRLGFEWYVNSPLAVYMIGIAFIMVGTIYFRFSFFQWVRIAVNAYYLFWIVYIPLTEGLVKANPHRICAGYYLNVIVPIVYLGASIMQVIFYRSELR
ncbi:MAG: hypothetical protein N2316_01535 [Spirochaetes bacterium]|nr:hypothetical protein [Spirochaetota bacterium]